MYTALRTSDEFASVNLSREAISRQPTPEVAAPQIEQFDQEPDHIAPRRHSSTSLKLGLMILGGLVGGGLISVGGAGVYKLLSSNESNSVCLPKSTTLETVLPQFSNHAISDLGVFTPHPNLLDSTNQAEAYLNTSTNARGLFERLLKPGFPVPLHYYFGDNSYEHRGVIAWNDKNLVESKYQTFNATSTACGTHSPALVLAHEAEHADWFRSNPLGQALLRSLNGYPFYDNLEEARTIWATNRIAADLHESQRATHHGRYTLPVENVTDANHQVCPGGKLTSEQSNIEEHFSEGRESEQLFSASISNAEIWSMMRPYIHEIPNALIHQTNNLLHERGNIVMQLNAAISHEKFSDIDFEKILQPHIEHAIHVATQFYGIGRNDTQHALPIMVHE